MTAARRFGLQTTMRRSWRRRGQDQASPARRARALTTHRAAATSGRSLRNPPGGRIRARHRGSTARCPERISYRDILEFFFQIHRPDLGEGHVGADYRSEIFYASDEQRQVAADTIADTDASGIWPGKVVTKISEAGPFWAAKADDQDYLRHYPDGKDHFHT